MGANQSQASHPPPTAPPAPNAAPNAAAAAHASVAPTAPPAPAGHEEFGDIFRSPYGGPRSRPSTRPAQTAVSSDGLLEYSTLFARDYVMQGVVNNAHVVINLQGLQRKTYNRPKFELTLVLDVSGSMSGQPLALAKQTIVQMLDCVGPEDVVHLITYGSNAQVLFQNVTRAQIEDAKAKVQNAHCNGGTNMEAGLRLADSTISSCRDGPMGQNTSSAVFLFSDGHANEGIHDTPSLVEIVKQMCAKHQCRVSSFGIGQSYNEELMRNISVGGEGNYLFIPSANDIPQYVELAFRGLTNPIGLNAEVRVKAGEGVMVTKALGYPNDCLLKGFYLGLLREDNMVQVILEVEVKPTGKDMQDMTILEWELTYTSCETNEPVVVHGACTTTITTEQNNLQFENSDVVVAVKLFEVCDANASIANFLQSRQLTKAKQLQGKCLEVLRPLVPLDSSRTQRVKVTVVAMEKTYNEMKEDQSQWQVEKLSKHCGYRHQVSSKQEEWMYQMM